MSASPDTAAASFAVDRDRTPPNDREISSRDKAERLPASDDTHPTTSVETASKSAEPVWRRLSCKAKHRHVWTNAELHACIKEDHLWLNPDPVKAEMWKNKLLANDNPTRSLAMYKKWAFWQKIGVDKKPRSGVRGGGVGRQRYSLRSGEK